MITPLIRTFIMSCATAVLLATLGTRYAVAQEAPSVVLQQMQEQMRLMEERLQKAEQRASRAEAMVTDMQKDMRASKLRGQEQAKKLQPEPQPEAQALAENKDFKSSTVPVLEEKPFATLDVNYFYWRTGFGTNFHGGQRETNDGRNTAFVNPLVSDNNAGRLGNELDTYAEPSFKIITNPLRDSPASFGGVLTLSSYTPQRTQIDLKTDIRVLDFYGFAKDAISIFPGAEVWAGRRGYLYQFYINIIDRRQMVIGGDGGGINNIALGDFAKLDLAYLSASPFGGSPGPSVNPDNPLGSTFGEIRTDNGNLNKQAGYIRLHDIMLPGNLGQLSLQGQYVYAAGGRALAKGDFQGVPGGGIFNNLDFTGIVLPPSDGVSVGLVHDYKMEFGMDKANKVSNHLYLGAGWGNEFDTTNANKLRASPYFFVSTDVLLANGKTVFTLADAHAFKVADQLNLYLGKTFELDAFAAYEHQNDGRPNVPLTDPTLNGGAGGAVRARGIQDWFDIGVRPTFNLTPWFALVAEGTYQYIDNEAFNATRAAAGFSSGPGNLVKLTFCPTFHYGAVGNYPIELRVFYTFAAWDDNLKGSIVGGDAYRNSNTGHIVGTQVVINF